MRKQSGDSPATETRLSVFRLVDLLVGTGFQMGLDNGFEWFHLSYTHARSAIIPFSTFTVLRVHEEVKL